MVLKLYNTMGRKKEIFKEIEKGKVRMYVCGPTVYGPIHIGNARTFMTFDILYRYLKYKEYKVKYVQNLTDVGHLTDIGEDKIMKGAAEKGMEPFDFVELMIKNYFEDLRSLNISKPDISPRASDHIKDMIEVIKNLIEKGYAYESGGYIYYDITKFKDYGKLSGQRLEELKEQRIEPHPKKRNPGDFALWIPAPQDYPMKWESPFGLGFPGWHIECSTMSSKYLGLPFDIHGGGKDLIFPHHEDEIAQAEAASGKKFVNYWMHGEFILVEGKKMSKSLGNIILVRDAVKKYGAKSIRYFLFSSHYKTEIDLTEKAMKAAESTVKKFTDFIFRLKKVEGKENKKVPELIKKIKLEFENAMDDDLNMPEALSKLFEFMREVNSLIDKRQISKKNALDVYNTMLEFDKVLGLDLAVKKEEISDEIKGLIEQREEARKKKDFAEADKIRKELKEKGILLEDTPTGVRWRRAK